MRIVIEIPEEFEADYNVNRFSDFFSRVMADIDYNGICGNYERETADVLAEAFKNSRVVQPVAYKGGRLIDADAMNELLFYKQVGGKDSLITAESAFEMINAQPTAYDVDAVVEQLWDASFERFGCDTGMGGELVINSDDAIQIVRGGSVDA